MLKVLVKDPELPGRTWAIQMPGCALVADLVVGLLRKRGGDGSRPCLMRLFTEQRCITDSSSLDQSIRSLKLEGKLLRSSWAVAPGHVADKCHRCQQLLARSTDNQTMESNGAVGVDQLSPPLVTSPLTQPSAAPVQRPAVREQARPCWDSSTSNGRLDTGIGGNGEAETVSTVPPLYWQESAIATPGWEGVPNCTRTISPVDPESNADPARRPRDVDAKPQQVTIPALAASLEALSLEFANKTPRSNKAGTPLRLLTLSQHGDSTTDEGALRVLSPRDTRRTSTPSAISVEPLECFVDRLERLAKLRSTLELSQEEYVLAKNIVLRQAQQQFCVL